VSDATDAHAASAEITPGAEEEALEEN
jgi:hypothetical protein